MKTEPGHNGWHDSALAVSYLGGLADPVVVLREDARIREGNGAFCAFASVARETMLNRPIRQALRHAPQLESFVDTATDLARHGAAARTLLALEVPGRGERTLLLTGIPVRDSEGTALLAIRVEDITVMMHERGEIEAEHLAARASAQSLERLNDELVGFSYSVAHDLRAPLRFIDKFAYLLMEHHGHELSSEALQYAEQIREGTRQTAQLVEDLLQFSQVTGGDLERAAIDMERLVRQIVAQAHFDVDGRDVEFEVGELGMAYGDPAMVNQVFVNLIGNALKFTRPREKAEIRVSRAEREGQAVYTVADNGVGFDAADSERLFTVFQRYHQPDDFEGSGVGLAVVKRIVVRHGGAVWVESEVGGGARFHFTLAPAPTRSGDD